MAETTRWIEDARDRRSIAICAVFLASSLPIGLLFIYAGLGTGEGLAGHFRVTLGLFITQDMWIGPLIVLLLGTLPLWGGLVPTGLYGVSRRDVAIIALLAMASAFALRFLVHKNYNVTLDEFMPVFQAEIFRGGNLMASLTEQAFAVHKLLQPSFTYVDEEHRLWAQHYRPVHAALLSIFPEGYEAAISHSLLTGLSVLAMASIARRVFPDRPGAPLLAVCLLIASPQVLLTAASGFAFTTHLAFNTVWLALFLRGSWAAHIAAAGLGFLALGIHQVHVHAIYVLPFGIALLAGFFGNRLKTIPYVAAYGIGVPFWIVWPEVATWIQTGDSNALPRTLHEVEYISNYLNWSQTHGQADRQFSLILLAANIWRFALWISPAIVLLASFALVSRRPLGKVPLIAGLGILFYIFLAHLMMPNQMYTIGSRYYHPFLGSLVVVALAAYYGLAESRVRHFVIALLLGGAVFLLPARAMQVYQKVAPLAAIQAQLDSITADNIIIRMETNPAVYVFVRNDPYLQDGPIFYAGSAGESVSPIRNGTTVRITEQQIREKDMGSGSSR